MKKVSFDIRKNKLLFVVVALVIVVGVTMTGYYIQNRKSSVKTQNKGDNTEKISSQDNKKSPQTKINKPATITAPASAPTPTPSKARTTSTSSTKPSSYVSNSPSPAPTQCDLQRAALYSEYNKNIADNSKDHQAILAYLKQLWDNDVYGDDYNSYQDDIDAENEEFHKDALVISDDYRDKQRTIGCNV